MSEPYITLDAREEIQRGGEPFAQIMNAMTQLKPRQGLRLLVPFEPVPLYSVLGTQGYAHETRPLVQGGFEVLFTPANDRSFVSPHYNQYVVATTHLFVLGWILSIVMGAMYQLVPVALETQLFSERLGRWQFLFHLIGWTGMVYTFWIWNMTQVGHYGSVMALGMVLFIYNIGRTLAQVPRWNITAGSVASALGWLFLVMCAGLYVACAKCWNFSPFYPVDLRPRLAQVASPAKSSANESRFLKPRQRFVVHEADRSPCLSYVPSTS